MYYIFEKKLCCLDISAMTSSAYLCLERFFVLANCLCGGMTSALRDGYFEIHTLQLLGLDVLWSVVESVVNPVVLNRAVAFLSKLPKQVSQATLSVGGGEKILAAYIDHCMKALTDSQKRQRGLQSLWAVIEEVEGMQRQQLPRPHEAMMAGTPFAVRMVCSCRSQEAACNIDDELEVRPLFSASLLKRMRLSSSVVCSGRNSSALFDNRAGPL